MSIDELNSELTLAQSFLDELVAIFGIDAALYFLDYCVTVNLDLQNTETDHIIKYINTMKPQAKATKDAVVTAIQVLSGTQKIRDTRAFVNMVRYNITATLCRTAGVRILNYGYKGEDASIDPGDLLPEERPLRYGLQLYQRLVRAERLENKDILEVGSGMGGGARYLSRIHNPNSYTALDASSLHVQYCNEDFGTDTLNFVHGDAQSLPLEEGCFDVVLNLESAHCYSNPSGFVNEVYRVLKPGGIFCMAEFFTNNEKDKFLGFLEERGFTNICVEKITEEVKKGFDLYLPELQKLRASFQTEEEGDLYENFIATRAFKTEKSNWREESESLEYWRIEATKI